MPGAATRPPHPERLACSLLKAWSVAQQSAAQPTRKAPLLQQLGHCCRCTQPSNNSTRCSSGSAAQPTREAPLLQQLGHSGHERLHQRQRSVLHWHGWVGGWCTWVQRMCRWRCGNNRVAAPCRPHPTAAWRWRCTQLRLAESSSYPCAPPQTPAGLTPYSRRVVVMQEPRASSSSVSAMEWEQMHMEWMWANTQAHT